LLEKYVSALNSWIGSLVRKSSQEENPTTAARPNAILINFFISDIS
jgi:hypothetical protein